MKISISALSIAYGLTPEALRYYEEKGLLSPERTPQSGFRRFSLADVQRLGIIKSLQRQGFSLDEIKRIMTCCTLSELIAMMDEKRAGLREQITLSRAIYDRITACTDLLRDSKEQCMKPRICAGTAAYMIDFESVAALWDCVPRMPLLKDLIDAMPLTSYCTVVPLPCLHGKDMPTRVGIVAPVEYSTVIHADFSKMHMSAGPRTVRTSFELLAPKNVSIDSVLECARSFLAENHLSPVCAGYTRQYAWFIDEHGVKRQYSELIVPIT